MPGARSPKLTVKQQLFIEAYLGKANGNATEAARLAGYSGNDKTLAVVGNENLSKPYLAEMVAERLDKALARMSADKVLAELEEIAAAPWDLFSYAEYDRDGNVTNVKLKVGDKIRALELLGKHHKLFTEKHELSGPNGGPIPAQIVRMPAKESPDAWSKRNK